VRRDPRPVPTPGLRQSLKYPRSEKGNVDELKATVCQPDISTRPFNVTVEQQMRASPASVFKAWTRQFDKWFAAPGTVLMKPRVNEPFFFETHFSDEKVNGQRHPHYGRFLNLRPNKLVEMTWVTGPEGTEGVETMVTVELRPSGRGTKLRLTHAGFANEKSRKQHEDAWPRVLKHLDETLIGPGKQ
jgi:uncharacterized protein YndB with AHSA1/START domain